MNNDTITAALQKLVMRLNDAEKQHLEIAKSTSNQALREWCLRYSEERDEMHKLLEGHISAMGGDPEVRTSYLSSLHRALINPKISTSNDEFSTIVTEIHRNATALIAEYDQVIAQLELHPSLKINLEKQKATIQLELSNLIALKEELRATVD